MSSDDVATDEVELPIKRTTGETLEDRLTANAYHNILPARYLRKNADGEPIENPEGLFDRVARNVVDFAEAVFEAEKQGVEVTVTPDQLKPDHPRRDELAADVFGTGTTATDDVETTLTAHNVNKFAYSTVVPELPEGVREHVEATADRFRDGMESLSFMPNSPTLMNAGDELQQLSACFVDSPADDITDIHQTAKEAAEVFQSGGGGGTRSGSSSAPTATRSARPAGSPPARSRSCGRSTRCARRSRRAARAPGPRWASCASRTRTSSSSSTRRTRTSPLLTRCA